MGLERFVAGIARHLSRQTAWLLALPWLRRPLHRRAVRAWRTSSCPLILCHGNINRSPFAAQLTALRDGRAASSAGLYPVEGRVVPDRAIALAEGYGVDLSEHRSRFADREVITGAGAIFVLDFENAVRLLVRDPRVLPRLHLLGALADTGPVVIDDPHGRSDAVLGTVFSQIAEAIPRVDASATGR